MGPTCKNEGQGLKDQAAERARVSARRDDLKSRKKYPPDYDPYDNKHLTEDPHPRKDYRQDRGPLDPPRNTRRKTTHKAKSRKSKL